MSRINLNNIDLDNLDEDDVYDELYTDDWEETPRFREDRDESSRRKKFTKKKPRDNKPNTP